jgi:hypothetical protein
VKATGRLPFRGRAQYVADYGVWFGFSREGWWSDVCAADLSAGARPAQWHVWANVDGLANHVGGQCRPYLCYISYMGCGRFCVTQFLWARDRIDMAVVTAVEATRAVGDGVMQMVRDGGVLMVRRASRCYHFPRQTPCCWAY